MNRNIGLTFDFLRQVTDDPAIINKIPNGSVLEFVEKDFPIKKRTTLSNKYIIRVKSVFEPINKVAELEAKYEKRNKLLL